MPYSDYLLDKMGHAELVSGGPFEAASLGSLVIRYTTGAFGLDDLGSIRVAWRNCSDMAKPQFNDPTAPGYTTAEASNGAALQCVFERNIRPYSKAITITATSGYLSPGDAITLRIGDKRRGSPGIRMQSAVETGSEIAIAVDPFNTRDFALLPERLTFSVFAAEPKHWRAVLPTLRRAGEPFRLCLRADDACGNPTHRADATLHLRANGKIRNLPRTVAFLKGAFAQVVEGLIVDEPADVSIDVLDEQDRLLASSNGLRVVAEAELLPYWADFHWQSRETVGMGTIRDGLAFARDRAFIDMTSHAANDLQLTAEQWQDLDRAFAEFNETGRFVVLPGYEWSGNTPLGGDRNVIFRREGGTLRRSSHALVPDKSDVATDCNDARDLFKALKAGGEDVLTFAHVGGRHCNIKHAHDPAIETAIEVHSTYWGTFPWLIQDAFEMGYRMGLVCNSDDHKGRPGASTVGFAEWGNGGGLTCVLARELSRDGVWEALKKRRHFGTTGVRLHLDTRAGDARMGDIAQATGDSAEFRVEVLSAIPVHRLEIRNGLKTVGVIHPHADDELGDRIQITFEGAEFRGRMPATVWDGTAVFSEARVTSARPLNFALKHKSVEQTGPQSVTWSNITTGNMVGIQLALENSRAGTLRVTTPQGEEMLSLAEVGAEEAVFDYGKLGRRMRVFRLPAGKGQGSVSVMRQVALVEGDNPLYAIVTLADCNQAFASPIYLVR